jgi:3-hydroxyacyl-[acyl-carrier-protein] dehydratase
MSAVTLLPGAEVVRCDEGGIELRVPVPPDSQVFAGHYPHFSLLPGVFTLDAVHGAVCRHAAAMGQPKPVLAEIGSVRFASPVFPGDVVTVDCTVKTAGDTKKVTARCETERGKTATFRLNYR